MLQVRLSRHCSRRRRCQLVNRLLETKALMQAMHLVPEREEIVMDLFVLELYDANHRRLSKVYR
jgi:hypothetical protein